VVRSRPYVSADLKGLLERVAYPVHFLDFETAGPAVPRYPGTRPYQTLPFQWSDHILSRDGSIRHRAFLCIRDEDPREAFAESLIGVLKDAGTIVIYTPYEIRILKELSEHLPGCAARLEGFRGRVVDLEQIIRRHFYHPAFGGSFSLKAVLPALVPEMDYGSLAIRDGSQAACDYLRMIDPQTPPGEQAFIRESLLAYCAQDTLAMVRIREALLKMANGSGRN
jgi:hypothetical protein